MLSEPLPRLLAKFTIPSFIAIGAVFLFGIVDTYFASKLGTEALAAMGISFPVLFFVTSIGLGLGVGSLSVIAPQIGGEHQRKAAWAAWQGVLFVTGVALVLAVGGIMTSNIYLNLFDVSQSVAEMARAYNMVVLIGSFFYILPIALSSMIRAHGNALMPAIVMGTACVLNVIFDPILMFGLGPVPRLGLVGAAYATVSSAGVSAVIALWFMVRKKMIFWSLEGALPVVRQIFTVGGLSALGNLLLPLTFALASSQIAEFGTAAVGGVGIGMKIEPFLLALPVAMTASVPPIVGIAWGARDIHRVSGVMALANRVVVVWQFALAVLVFFSAPLVSHLFTGDADVGASLVLYLRMMSVTFAFEGILFVVSSSLNALDLPWWAIFLDAARIIFFILALVLLGSDSLYAIFGAIMIGNVGVGLLSLWVQKRTIRSLQRATH